MSNRTIIEINHDRWGEIGRDPEAFGRDLLSFLGSASHENAERLERYGIVVVGTAHHSADRAVHIDGRLHRL